jgi:hypothetical protein
VKSNALLALIGVCVAGGWIFSTYYKHDVEAANESPGVSVGKAPALPLHPSISPPVQPLGNQPFGSTKQSSKAASSPVNPPVAMSYGQFVVFALSGGTATEAMHASDILAICKNEASLRTGLDSLKGKSVVTAEKLSSLINESEATLRACQTISVDSYQAELPLAEKALRGQVLGAAARYGDKVDYRPPPSMLTPLLEGLRAEGRAGKKSALVSLVLHGRDLGLDKVEVYAYYLALLQIGESNQIELLNRAMKARDTADLTAGQKTDAERLAESIYRQWPNR